jgi:hypothetical protein
MRTTQPFLIVSIVVSSIVHLAFAGDTDEHRRFARQALDSVYVECGRQTDGMATSFPHATTFEGLSGTLAENDMARARFHERGRTILEQLSNFEKNSLETILRECNADAIGVLDDTQLLKRVQSVEQSRKNVVVNYLLPHLVALHCARAAAKDSTKRTEALRQAWTYEARAQGYLLDAFCSGHILTPMFDVFYWLHGKNNERAHHEYNSDGAYVINSRKEAWQTFGDQLLEWYEPTHAHALEACRTSLRELLLTYFISKDQNQIPERLRAWATENADGKTPAEMVDQWLSLHDTRWYYESATMPVLLHLPMAISAAWSEPSERVDKLGIHERNLFPQLRENGLHDSDDVEIDSRFIYPSATVPVWMRFPISQSPNAMIRNDPRVASVRYVQERDHLPSYEGLLTHLRVGTDGTNGTKFFAVGAGYGFTDKFFLFLRNFSPDVVLLRADDAWFLQATGGISFLFPNVENIVTGTRLEVGYLKGLGDASDSYGTTVGAGVESSALPFWFTNAGITARIMYRFVATHPRGHTVSFELVLQ